MDVEATMSVSMPTSAMAVSCAACLGIALRMIVASIRLCREHATPSHPASPGARSSSEKKLPTLLKAVTATALAVASSVHVSASTVVLEKEVSETKNRKEEGDAWRRRRVAAIRGGTKDRRSLLRGKEARRRLPMMRAVREEKAVL